MQVILSPLSSADLDEIVIKDRLLSIGRLESPFSDYPGTLVSRLSRRHARLFLEQGRAFVTDMGSKNGTTLNAKALTGQPAELHQGDEICFGQALCYRVALIGRSEEPASPAGAPCRMTLKPATQDSVLDQIVIDGFPFLVGKQQEVFSRYRETASQEVNYLSRRHAHIFRSGGDIYVEDLGSTNGTFVSGQRLGEQAQVLQEGDTLAFGGDYFVYSVHPERLVDESGALDENTRIVAAQPDLSSAPAHTTFVSTADSFLDIFCIEASESEEKDKDADREEVASGSSAARRQGRRARAGRPGALRRLRLFFGQIKNTSSTSGRGNPWPALAGVIGLSLAATAAVYVYLDTGPEGEIRSLMEAGDPRGGALLANQYLQMDPDDRTLSDIGSEALLQAVLPDWMEQVQAQDFAGAETSLKQAAPLTTANSRGERFLDLLDWVIRLEVLTEQRGGAQAPIPLFEYVAPVRAVLSEWDDARAARTRDLTLIAKAYPPFERQRTRIYSLLRVLKEESAVYLPAIEGLISGVRDDLKNGGDPTRRFEDIREKYPRLTGLERLTEEWNQYRSIRDKINAGQLVAAMELRADARVKTPVFAQALEELGDGALPSSELMGQYREAEAAWRTGDLNGARAILKGLMKGEWKALAERRLTHMEKVASDFEALIGHRGSDRYAEKVFEYRSSLDPQQDVFYVRKIEQDYQQQRARVLERTGGYAKKAADLWMEYQKRGGITGVHRLESRVSERFTALAGTLSAAFDQAARVKKVYDFLDMAYPATLVSTYDAVAFELSLQRRSLRELRSLTGDRVVQAKLDLLKGTVPDS